MKNFIENLKSLKKNKRIKNFSILLETDNEIKFILEPIPYTSKIKVDFKVENNEN